jgi:hypothetical protein
MSLFLLDGVKLVRFQAIPILKSKKEDDNYYFQTIINGQFAYGHYFKYQGKENDEYKYIRTDGTEVEFIFVNYPLSKLALSNEYDQKIILKLVNYRTSFGMLMKF